MCTYHFVWIGYGQMKPETSKSFNWKNIGWIIER